MAVFGICQFLDGISVICSEFLLTGCLGGITCPRLDDAFIDLSIENSGGLSIMSRVKSCTVFLRTDVNIR